jgi:hypothetical protein
LSGQVGAAAGRPSLMPRKRRGLHPQPLAYFTRALMGTAPPPAYTPLPDQLRQVYKAYENPSAKGAAVDDPTYQGKEACHAGAWDEPEHPHWKVGIWTLNRIARVLQPSSLVGFGDETRANWRLMLTAHIEANNCNGGCECMVWSARAVRAQPHMSIDQDGQYVTITLASYQHAVTTSSTSTNAAPSTPQPVAATRRSQRLLNRASAPGAAPPPPAQTMPGSGAVVDNSGGASTSNGGAGISGGAGSSSGGGHTGNHTRLRMHAHALVHWLHQGMPPLTNERPDSWIVMHRCNRPQCVNPHHLVWGTKAQNAPTLKRPEPLRPNFESDVRDRPREKKTRLYNSVPFSHKCKW